MAKKEDKILAAAVAGVFIVAALILAGALSRMNSVGASGARVGVVEVSGVITSSQGIVRQLEAFRKQSAIKAVVVRIESPGGGIAASQEIYEHVRRVRELGKPVIASMGSVAASGGYYVALGADTIMANPGTTTGSIGVIAEFPTFAKLLDKIGVEMTVVKSGRFKDTGSPYRAPRADELAYLQSWIDDGYEQFVQTVARERGMEVESVRRLADGRVYSGRQALNFGLIDTLGTFQDAVNLAAEAAGIKGEPKVIRARKTKTTLFDLIFTTDLNELIESRFSTNPRALYLMR